MITGVVLCGLNGSGKSTLGQVLAERLGFSFLDSEDLFFPKSDPSRPYASPRSRAEAEELLFQTLQKQGSFVVAAVKGNFGERILPFYRYAVLLHAPKEIRLQRVRERSFQKFGARMLPGGDLYREEEEFFRMADSRPEEEAEACVRTLSCPVLRADGTKPPEENAALLAKLIQGEGG